MQLTKTQRFSLFTLLLCTCSFMYFSFSETTSEGFPEVPYPTGFRNWTHVKTQILGPDHPFIRFRGIHHIYANDKAMEGYENGSFADGSIIVFDQLEAKNEKSLINEGERLFIDVMVKDSNRYDSTGGWGFEEFQGSSLSNRNIKSLAKQMCYNCHAKGEPADLVFSSFRK